jgi:hypothetical protein
MSTSFILIEMLGFSDPQVIPDAIDDAWRWHQVEDTRQSLALNEPNHVWCADMLHVCRAGTLTTTLALC